MGCCFILSIVCLQLHDQLYSSNEKILAKSFIAATMETGCGQPAANTNARRRLRPLSAAVALVVAVAVSVAIWWLWTRKQKNYSITTRRSWARFLLYSNVCLCVRAYHWILHKKEPPFFGSETNLKLLTWVASGASEPVQLPSNGRLLWPW